MSPLQLLLILRAHYKPALVAFVLTLIGGGVFSYLMPKQYVSMSSLVFDVRTPDPVAGVMMPVAQGYMATQIEIIKSDHLAQRVVEMLKLDKNPTLIEEWKKSAQGKVNIQQWLGDRIQKGLSVAQSKNTNIFEISYSASDPTFAATLANAYAQAYINTNIDLRVDPARQYSAWFAEQAKLMRENLEKAQTRLSQYQQEHGIVAKEGEMDAEMSKLNELVAQLTAVQGQTVDIQSKSRSSEVLPAFAESSLVQTLKGDIARLEVKLQEAGENLGRNHPQYQRMEAELASLKNQMEVEKLNVSRELSVSRTISRDKEGQLRAAIEAQKKKLLELKGGHDDLAVLQRDVDAAKSAYDNVVKRYNQTSLESQIDQTNVSILNPAIEPRAPESPNQRKNALITLLASILMAAGTAMLLEFLDRRVRTVRDLEDMLQVPVLAVIAPPRGTNRLARLAGQTLKLEFK